MAVPGTQRAHDDGGEPGRSGLTRIQDHRVVGVAGLGEEPGEGGRPVRVGVVVRGRAGNACQAYRRGVAGHTGSRADRRVEHRGDPPGGRRCGIGGQRGGEGGREVGERVGCCRYQYLHVPTIR